MDWDLTAYFPAFDSPERETFVTDLSGTVANLVAAIMPKDCITEPDFYWWSDYMKRYDDAICQLSHLASYTGCLCSADSTNEDYLRAHGKVTEIQAAFSKLNSRLMLLLRQTQPAILDDFLNQPDMEDLAYAMRRLHQQSQKQMSQMEEELAADLSIDGIRAWSHLYDNLSGRLTFKLETEGQEPKEVSMSQRRSLLGHPDRAIRQSAFVNGNKSWNDVEYVTASALNAIAGVRHTLNGKRRVDHFLDVACFQSGTSRKTLDAMIEAVLRKSQTAKRYLALLARKYELPAVTYFDLEAPLVSGQSSDISWDQCCQWVSAAFHRTYPDLGAFFDRLINDKWVDYRPRSNKRPGGFCSSSKLIGQSRIFMTYAGTINDLMTLAHEAGHAYHSHLLREKPGLAKNYPMTLAESASTFAELVFADGMLKTPDLNENLSAMIMDTQAQHAVSFILDIPVRFLFEKKFYEARMEGEVPVSEIKAMMTESQREVFGDSLQPGGEDPLFWASKLHFYIDDVTFYNFPYTFGFLISRSLFGRYREQGDDFFPVYEDFMRKSGSMTCEDLVYSTLGDDIGEPAFWEKAIQTLEEPVSYLERYCR